MDNIFILAAATNVEPNLVYVWEQATVETKLILFVLAIMSIFAWSVMASKTIQMRRARNLNRIFLEEYKQQPNVMDIYERDVRVEGCPLFNIYREACMEVKTRLRNAEQTDVKAADSAPASSTTVTETESQPVGMDNLTGAPIETTATPMVGGFQFQLTSTLPISAAPQAADSLAGSAVKTEASRSFLSIKSVEHVKRTMERTVAEESLKLEGGLIMLAIAVSGSPFLGLLGTVWGVMSAFSYVGAKGSADLATMAPGVAGALIATVGGLLVAIPSMFAYNWLVHNLRVFTVEMDNFAQDMTSKIETEFLQDE